jgi:hypothetical protein
MARMSVPDVGNLDRQTILDCGINVFALDLLVESYADARRAVPPPVEFVFRGIVVSLKPYEEPCGASPEPTEAES